MGNFEFSSASDKVRQFASDLNTVTARGYGALLELIGDRRIVLIGDASHGTHEFYRERAEITKRLIAEKKFNAVAVEADFPDAARINCFVRGGGSDTSADEALSNFRHFPAWMWANHDVCEFVSWLREFNDQFRDDREKVSFYGLDLYSMQTSMQAVVGYLEKTDPEAAKRARARYSCFDEFGGDTEKYAYATAAGVSEPCDDEVIQQMLELNRRWAKSDANGGLSEREAVFVAEQNARIVVDAEEYYRTMFRSDVKSWNLRDRHMAETITAIERHVSSIDSVAKIVVWAHNSHLGDAAFTEMGRGGELNVGQLIREKFRKDAFLIGFTTFAGTVTAASDWGGEGRKRVVRPALAGSVERVFHDSGLERFLLPLQADEIRNTFEQDLLERAIGVIYRPETERRSHYFNVRLAGQFDAVIHIDETSAIEPLNLIAEWSADETMETFPTGI